MPIIREFNLLNKLTPEVREALYISVAVIGFIGIIGYIYIKEKKVM